MKVNYYLDLNTNYYIYEIRQIYSSKSSNSKELVESANFDLHQHTAENLVQSFNRDLLHLKGINKLHEAESKILANIKDHNLILYIRSIFNEIYSLNESNNKAELNKTYMPVRNIEDENILKETK